MSSRHGTFKARQLSQLDDRAACVRPARSTDKVHRVAAQAAVITTVVRKNSTTVRQNGPRGCTRAEVRLTRSAPPLDLIGRTDASGVGAGGVPHRLGKDEMILMPANCPTP